MFLLLLLSPVCLKPSRLAGMFYGFVHCISIRLHNDGKVISYRKMVQMQLPVAVNELIRVDLEGSLFNATYDYSITFVFILLLKDFEH